MIFARDQIINDSIIERFYIRKSISLLKLDEKKTGIRRSKLFLSLGRD